jgi:3-hydroxyisobutyrate dehydrogenase-like beta-hydroxyacid dehydrogenase
MGSALARAFLGKGSDVTVWNRTQSKCEPLLNQGARAASTISEAIAASPLSVICISDYSATSDILQPEDVRRELRGRVVVQLSSGTPQEARESEAWMGDCGAEYLDGAILAFPRTIGTPDAMILVSGPSSAFEKHRSTLDDLGTVVYVGESIGLASTQDTAGVSFFMAALMGFMQGAVIFESEGLSVEDYLALAESVIPVLTGELHQVTERIKTGKYDDTDAELNAWTAGAEHLVQVSRENGITSEVPDFLARVFNQAISAGHSKHDIAALMEIFRNPASG